MTTWPEDPFEREGFWLDAAAFCMAGIVFCMYMVAFPLAWVVWKVVKTARKESTP